MLPFHDWPTFFETIRVRPNMWIGGKSLHRLFVYIGGFRDSEEAHGIGAGQRFGGFDFEQFEQFVASKIRECSYGSLFLAREATRSEEEAFDLWFAWYDEFRRSTHADKS